MEPHGEGNPAPVFCSTGTYGQKPAIVVRQDTIKFWVSDGVKTISAVGFGMGSFKDKVKLGAEVDLAYTLSIDDWNKAPAVQLMLKDIIASFCGVTLLAWMQLVQTKARCTVPFKMILMRCRLGSTMRKHLPTILEPAPPFFFSIPRLLYFLPDVGLFSQTIQDLMKLPL